ncbi:hypothetical protein Q9L58_009370 [Maublancomyces gigas]|uniref:Uncharacterized protein n=1 Tax=Discina gigas TaxID=1032678 RepID=A0ABR3G730_9PEZI
MSPRGATIPNPIYVVPYGAVPQIQAQAALCAFRQESELSWPAINRLWMDVCNILNSPSHDILLDANRSHELEYHEKLAELTRDVLTSGVFGPDTQGRWRYGRHTDEPDQIAIVDFIARLTMHAARGILDQVTACDHSCDVKADKVGAWLMNEEATIWDQYEFVDREAVSNEDYHYQDYGTAAPRARTPDATRVSESRS